MRQNSLGRREAHEAHRCEAGQTKTKNPTSAQMDEASSKFGRTSAEFGRSWAEVGPKFELGAASLRCRLGGGRPKSGGRVSRKPVGQISDPEVGRRPRRGSVDPVLTGRVHVGPCRRRRSGSAYTCPVGAAMRVMTRALVPGAVAQAVSRRLGSICPALSAQQRAAAWAEWAPTLRAVGTYAAQVFLRLPLNAWTTDGRLHPQEGVARCRFGCREQPDDLRHYVRCARAWPSTLRALCMRHLGGPPRVGGRRRAANCGCPRLGRGLQVLQHSAPRRGRRRGERDRSGS